MTSTTKLGLLGTLLAGAQLASIAVAQSTTPSTAPVPAPATTLQPPVRIFAGKEAIDVTTGHAAPYVLDFDGDGNKDLLTGEFGDGEFPAAELPAELSAGWKQGGNFANGRLRIYRNLGTNEQKRFETFEYLRAGGGIATVPMT